MLKVTVIRIVIGALVTVTNELVKEMEDLEIRERVETNKTTALLLGLMVVFFNDVSTLSNPLTPN